MPRPGARPLRAPSARARRPREGSARSPGGAEVDGRGGVGGAATRGNFEEVLGDRSQGTCPKAHVRRIGQRTLGALLLLVVGLVLSACAAPLRYSAYVEAASYRQGPLSPRARVFLIAGGVDVANFAEEVVIQRRFWRSQGLTDDEIACYYAKPVRSGYEGDRRQFRRLLADLDGCYPASTDLVRRHLAEAARRAPPFLYVYVTSHGLPSLVGPGVPLPPDEIDLLDNYLLQLGAGVGYGIHGRRILAAYRKGAAADDLLFTPRALASALAQAPADTAKILVLQGCHSGGFLDEPRGRAEALTSLPNLTAIAAARYDRTSFGCDAGPDQTYFGGLFNRLLPEYAAGKAPPEVAWRSLYDHLRREIEVIEANEGATPSEPVFYASPTAAPTNSQSAG
ncbi:MAG: C13 family peptidase [Nannocystaceae bacterium]